MPSQEVSALELWTLHAHAHRAVCLSVCLWEAFVQGKPFLFLVSARLCVEVLVNEPQSSTHNRLQFNKELYPGPQNQLSVLSTEVTIELIGEPCI